MPDLRVTRVDRRLNQPFRHGYVEPALETRGGTHTIARLGAPAPLPLLAWPARASSGENSRTKVQIVVADSTAQSIGDTQLNGMDLQEPRTPLSGPPTPGNLQ